MGQSLILCLVVLQAAVAQRPGDLLSKGRFAFHEGRYAEAEGILKELLDRSDSLPAAARTFYQDDVLGLLGATEAKSVRTGSRAKAKALQECRARTEKTIQECPCVITTEYSSFHMPTGPEP